MSDFFWITDPKRLKKFRMAFASVDKKDIGVISFKELSAVLKHIGESVSEAELRKMASQCEFEREDDIHYDEFLYMVATLCPEEDDKNEVIEALKVFDTGKGCIKVEDIRVVMGNLGERMSDEEIEKMLNEVTVFDTGKGCIKAEDIRVVMGNLGERMSDEEIEEMLNEVTVKNGLIKINEFATVLCR